MQKKAFKRNERNLDSRLKHTGMTNRGCII